MKYSKLVTLGLIGVLGLGIVGCNNKTDTNAPAKQESPQENQESTQAKQNQGMMNREMYTEEFGKYYNENLARLENYNTYNNIAVDKETENYPGNEKYLSDLKTAYKESETNLQKFVDSLKNVKTEDKEVKDMNDKLIAEGEKLIADIKAKNKKLEEVPADLMTKSEVEFRKGLNDLVTVKDQTEMGFNKMLKDARNTLGIK